jgi:hypothetical protein
MFDKKIKLIGYDTIAADLTLIKCHYFYNLDGNLMTIRGHLAGDSLMITTQSKGQTLSEVIPAPTPLFPTSIVNLYPVFKGLGVDRQFSYRVFDGQTRRISTVNQTILAYEESVLFPGPAFKIRTRMHGHETTTWINQMGKPLLEMSLGGVIISTLEDQNQAERYLTQTAINKHEPFIDYSLIKTDTVLPSPRKTESITLKLSGVPTEYTLPTDYRQRCLRIGNDVCCAIKSQPDPAIPPPSNAESEDTDFYLEPSYAVPALNPAIQRTARDISAGINAPSVKIHKIMAWLDRHIERKPVDAFTALDVLNTRQAECQGFAYLFAALCRAEGIPTRIVNGIVYSNRYQGFLYHSWVECYVSGLWLAIDPMFMQIPADATHLKLLVGESIAQLLPLVGMIGKLKVQIIEFRNTPP